MDKNMNVNDNANKLAIVIVTGIHLHKIQKLINSPPDLLLQELFQVIDFSFSTLFGLVNQAVGCFCTSMRMVNYYI